MNKECEDREDVHKFGGIDGDCEDFAKQDPGGQQDFHLYCPSCKAYYGVE